MTLDLHFLKRKQLSCHYSNTVPSIIVIFGQCLFRKHVCLHLQTQHNTLNKMYVVHTEAECQDLVEMFPVPRKRGAGSYYTQSNCLQKSHINILQFGSCNSEGMSYI